jgi:signal transduction histidine kinase
MNNIGQNDSGKRRSASLLMRLPLSRLSFRLQIIVLGTLAVVLLLAVLVGTFTAFQYRTSAVLNNERVYLSETTHELATTYEEKAQFEAQLGVPGLGKPSASISEALTLVSHVALEGKEGVQGGFYSRAEDVLVGYSSSEESGGPGRTVAEAISASDRDQVLKIARLAAATGKTLEQTLTSNRETLLIEAVPIEGPHGPTGSAWALRRLIVIPGSNRFRAYLLTAGLGAAAFACVILTLLVVRNLQSGVRKVETGLKGLEENLASRIPTDSDPDEIRRIADAVNRLGATLRENLEHEKQIEDRLRHAERLAALGRLVAGVAHEVRNPLATIRLRVQMCQRAAANLQVFESCAVALEEIERLNGMVNRLLSFAQPVQLHAEPSNLCRLVEQRLEIFREKAQHAGIRFVTNFSDTCATLQLDRGRIAQVFDNTIQNAMDAMSDSGGTLWVSVLPEAKTSAGIEAVCAEFRDTGKGMSPDVINRIFDPFFTTKPSGTGLGLSICHELVRAHRGEIQVDSIEGHGTTLRILLPLGREEVTV